MATDASAQPNGTSPHGGKPSILIIGGLGFIGRHLAHHIHTHNLASHYRVVDKVLPQLAHLAPEHLPCCSPPYFLQADAANPASHARIFSPPTSLPSSSDFKWDYILNLGGETSWSASPEVYAARTTHLTRVLGREAARRRCKAFVECSTGMVYKASREPSREASTVMRDAAAAAGAGAGGAAVAAAGSSLKPWLPMAQAKLDAENALREVGGDGGGGGGGKGEGLGEGEGERLELPAVILRLAHVYGEYDCGFASKFLCLARVYQAEGRELKWLWSEELRVNGVWVGDVVRAVLRAAEWRANEYARDADGEELKGEKASEDVKVQSPTKRRPTLLARMSNKSSSSPSAASAAELTIPTFNIVDHGDTSQGTLASLAASVFNIRTGFQGTLISQFAKLHLDSVVDDLNDENLGPWAELLGEKGLKPGPLSPFLEREMLGDKDLCLDGGCFERVCGFVYERPGGLDRRGVEEMVASYERVGWWP